MIDIIFKKPNSDTDISPNILVFNENLIAAKPLVEFIYGCINYIIYLNASKQNLSKLRSRNHKNFIDHFIGLSLIALTVRAVNFLDLIVENGYNVSTYFKYSFLNIFGVAPKFIPLSFLLAL